MKKRSLFGFLIGILIISFTIYNLWPEAQLPKSTSIDQLVVYKSKRQLQAFAQGKLKKTYRISLGGHTTGHKEFEGDKKTPEGKYFINDKNPNSGYHKNLGISYPNTADIAHAKTLGKPAGGDVKIHGLRNYMGFIGKAQRWFDWTLGCMALTNDEVDELYGSVPIGTPIDIRP